jgi:uncharacterized protein
MLREGTGSITQSFNTRHIAVLKTEIHILNLRSYNGKNNMSSDRKSFFLKLNPLRSTFMSDMTDDEKMIMQKHVAYWAPYIDDGTVIVLGPVFDPKGGYGIAVIQVDTDEQLKELTDNDPGNGLNHYEIYPMKAVTRQQ